MAQPPNGWVEFRKVLGERRRNAEIAARASIQLR